MERRYHCFLSYRHADNRVEGRQWATWLHQRIETYEVPSDLVGKTNDRGGVIPSRIFPVFRDEEELPADADLSQPITKALENSETLLVLCSPGATASRFVAEEIVRFKSLGRKDRIFAAILSGEPNAMAPATGPDSAECFPSALRCEVDDHGNLTSIPAEPIAADFRLPDGREGWTNPEAYREALLALGETTHAASAKAADYSARLELMVLKIVAGILGVPLGVLTRRDQAYQLMKASRRIRTLAAWLVVVAILAAAALAASVQAVRSQRAAAAIAIAVTPLALARDDSSDPVTRSLILNVIRDHGSLFQLRYDPQSLDNSFRTAALCQTIAAAAIEDGDDDLFAVLRGETLPASLEKKLRVAMSYADSMASIYAAIASRPTLETDLRTRNIDKSLFTTLQVESKMLKGALHLYMNRPGDAERELAAFVTEMQQWQSPPPFESARDMNVFEAATNLSQAYRLNGKREEAIRTASLAVDAGERWAGSDTSRRLRVAVRCIALDHFGLLDEPHRKRKSALLQSVDIADEDIAELKRLLEGADPPNE